jgi:ribose transport system substrate-binding protein
MSFVNHSRVIAVGAIALATILTATACSAGGGSGSATAGPGTAGIVEFDSTSQIDSLFVDGAQKALKAKGYTVTSQDPSGDPGKANSICTQFVTQQVKVLIVTTFALNQMATCMAGAKAANIPVFYIGSPLLAGMAGSVDVTSPKPINDLFIKYLKDNSVTDVLTLDYSPGTPCHVRADYRTKELANLPSVKVTKHEFPIPGQLVDAQNATAAWLQAHPAGSGKFAIWACFTDPTAGAVAAIKQAGRTDDIPIFTWDFNKEIQVPVAQGEVAATLSLNGTQVGGQIVEAITNYLKTGKAEGVAAENTILTKDNVAQFIKDNPDSVK